MPALPLWIRPGAMKAMRREVAAMHGKDAVRMKGRVENAAAGEILAIDIKGVGGRPLRDAWAEGPKAYLGLAVADFPNLFLITGPGSPSVLSNMISSIEQHVEWIIDCFGYLRAEGYTRIAADAETQEAWVDHVRRVADKTLFPRAASWYMGANIPGEKACLKTSSPSARSARASPPLL